MSVEKVDSEPNSIGDNLPIPPRENLVSNLHFSKFRQSLNRINSKYSVVFFF